MKPTRALKPNADRSFARDPPRTFGQQPGRPNRLFESSETEERTELLLKGNDLTTQRPRSQCHNTNRSISSRTDFTNTLERYARDALLTFGKKIANGNEEFK